MYVQLEHYMLIFLIHYKQNVVDAKAFKSVRLKVVGKDKIVINATRESTLLALEKVVFYYNKHREDVTVDFAFGLRAAEGEIVRILDLAQTGSYPEVDTETRERLEDLLYSIRNNLKKSFPYIEKKFKKYFEDFYFLLKEKWIPYQLTPHNILRDDIRMFPNISDDLDDLDEESSDQCMIGLVGNDEIEKCSLNQCWEKMTKVGKIHYYATHQLLWILLGEKYGCKEKMDKRAIKDGYKSGVDDVIKRLCAGIIIEMESLAESGVKGGMLDIFLEQGFVCGGIGFMEAVRPQWLKEAMSFQDPNVGCFPDMEPDIDNINEFKFWINYKREQWKSRRILSDSVLEDGCSTHTTGVAAGFLAVYLRLFFDPSYKRNHLDRGVALGNPEMYSGLLGIMFRVLCFFVILSVLTLKRRPFQLACKRLYLRLFR